jgi:hypothetical protein
MAGVEFAAGRRDEQVFAGLAARSGFSPVECALAARSEMLVDSIKIAELRSARRAQSSAAVALARVRELQGELLAVRAAGLL